MKRKASARPLVRVQDEILLEDMLPEMIGEMTRHLDPLSADNFRATCKRLQVAIPVSPLKSLDKGDYPEVKFAVLATAPIRFAERALKKEKGHQSDVKQAFYFYGQNPNHCQWEKMITPILVVQKRALRLRSKVEDLQWVVPLVWGLLYSGNDAILEDIENSYRDIYRVACQHYVTCMRQILARPDAFEFVTAKRLFSQITTELLTTR